MNKRETGVSNGISRIITERLVRKKAKLAKTF